jgi:Skp family chaperone for outer membrane proteins
MPQLRDFLERFRPAGAPGAAASAGVPADRSRELAAELDPVLALLADVDAECARIAAQAQDDAERIRAAAREQAAAMAADANRRAGAARREAAEAVLTEARAEAADAVARAIAQAAQTRELAAQRIPVLVSRAVDLIRKLGTADREQAAGALGWPP